MSRYLAISVTVTGGPDGDAQYHVRIGPDGARVHAEAAPDAPVRLSTDHATAAAIARGEESAQAAFMAGRLRVAGDLQAVVTGASMLAGAASSQADGRL